MRANPDAVIKFLKHPILDVGGGKCPFPFADVIFDLKDGDIIGDACEPWPFDNDSFGSIVCSHLLEDVRDPLFVCKEMQRVASRGYIETPAHKQELSTGHDEEIFIGKSLSHGRGYPHHRWIVQLQDNTLIFTFKYPYPYLIDSIKEPCVISNNDLFLSFYWKRPFNFEENFIIEPKEVEQWYKKLGLL